MEINLYFLYFFKLASRLAATFSPSPAAASRQRVTARNAKRSLIDILYIHFFDHGGGGFSMTSSCAYKPVGPRRGPLQAHEDFHGLEKLRVLL